jgi:cold shock CspA family protein
MQGIVVRYNAERGFGFLSGESSRGADTFFHKTAVVGGVVPPSDSVVEYVEEIGRDGRLRAVNVRPL